MRYSAAYALLFLAGNANPSVDELEGLVRVAGVEVDRVELVEFCDQMRGKPWHVIFYRITKTRFRPDPALA